MICKWCGESISSKQTTCPRCGKERPPMSECGGFYNIIDSQSVQNERSAPQAMSQRPAQQSQANKASTSKAAIFAIIVSLVALVIAIVSLALTFKNNKDDSDPIKDRTSTVQTEEGTADAESGKKPSPDTSSSQESININDEFGKAQTFVDDGNYYDAITLLQGSLDKISSDKDDIEQEISSIVQNAAENCKDDEMLKSLLSLFEEGSDNYNAIQGAIIKLSVPSPQENSGQTSQGSTTQAAQEILAAG